MAWNIPKDKASEMGKKSWEKRKNLGREHLAKIGKQSKRSYHIERGTWYEDDEVIYLQRLKRKRAKELRAEARKILEESEDINGDAQ